MLVYFTNNSKSNEQVTSYCVCKEPIVVFTNHSTPTILCSNCGRLINKGFDWIKK